MTSRHGLSAKDLDILKHYMKSGNRELYWNYLAQLPGNDGYGRLALGVVRNDNMPGATANQYARNHAREHDGKVFSEREWDNFGIDLVKRDFGYRSKLMQGGYARLALNLPALKVQEAHDGSFNRMGVDADAWTPRKLLEASRAAGRKDAEQAQRLAAARGEVLDEGALKAITEARVEQVWASLLNNDALGLHRGKDTLLGLAAAQAMPVAERAEYAKDMAAAYLSALHERPHTSPNIIGSTNHYYARDREGEWMEVHHADPTIGVRLDQLHDVDASTRRELEDTRDLRLHREAVRSSFHPDDPGALVPSPHPLADTSLRSTLPGPDDDPLYAAIRNQLPRSVPDDKVAAMAVQARHGGVRRPEDLHSVGYDDDRIVCVSHRGRHMELGLDAPSPPKAESIALAEQLDREAIDAERARMDQMQQLAMERPMGRGRSL